MTLAFALVVGSLLWLPAVSAPQGPVYPCPVGCDFECEPSVTLTETGAGNCPADVQILIYNLRHGCAQLDCTRCSACSCSMKTVIDCSQCDNGCSWQWGYTSFSAQCNEIGTYQESGVIVPPDTTFSGARVVVQSCCGSSGLGSMTAKAGGHQKDAVLNCACP
ncbi:MAG: hypothetical protein IT453_18520 [Planctomycetes bacterium]|nr:hypothetical protein [Planctomycetota bacterium]